jgi:hypothetical protein
MRLQRSSGTGLFTAGLGVVDRVQCRLNQSTDVDIEAVPPRLRWRASPSARTRDRAALAGLRPHPRGDRPHAQPGQQASAMLSRSFSDKNRFDIAVAPGLTMAGTPARDRL